MSTDEETPRDKIRRQRLLELLRLLEKQGLTQREVAARVSVPAQYLSDVKAGRRRITELFTRRLHEEFGVDYLWLLGKPGSMEAPRTSGGRLRTSGKRPVCLPVFSDPVAGEPRMLPSWDGSLVEVVGVAAAQARSAHQPYVLRLGTDDRRSRLRKNDLLLISQAINAGAEIHVLNVRGAMLLARRGLLEEWEPLVLERQISGKTTVIGHAVGIVWGML